MVGKAVEADLVKSPRLRRLDRIRLRWVRGLILLAVVVAAPTTFSAAAGTILVLLGMLIRALAAAQIKKDRELATQGMYALCRNPLYLGSITAYLGLGIASGWWPMALLMLLWSVWVYLQTIGEEENHLERVFGQEFLSYRRITPRLLPSPGSLGRMRSGLREISWQGYLSNREYGGTIALLVALGLVLGLRLGDRLGLAELLSPLLRLP